MITTTIIQKDLRLTATLALLLAVITFLVFSSVLRFDFLNWDDQSYVTENDHVKGGLTQAGVTWAFVKSHSANWHPITWLSHMADVSMFGMNPAGHHAINLVFHIANSVLLMLLLWLMTGSVWRSAMVAALFALHPLHVESVAWVAERKDVLSAFFGILTLMAYTHYVGESKVSGRKSKVWYGVALGLFALGLMSKPMLVTWPFVMLLLDFWPLNRVTIGGWQVTGKVWRRLVLEKIPYFALALASCWVTVLAQRKDDAMASIDAIPVLARLANATTSYVQYLAKFFWPQNLSAIYPLQTDIEPWSVIACFMALLCITILAWRARATSPFLLVGWLWFLGTLVPVIGLVQVGSQAFADRYTYLPLIGIMISAIWFAGKSAEKLRFSKITNLVISICVLSLLSWRTTVQIPVWKNTESLFSGVLARHPNNFQALYGLGGFLSDTGRIDEALPLLERALIIEPNSPETLGKMGDIFDSMGQYSDAAKYYETGLAAHPDHAGLLNNFAWLLAACPNSKIRDGKRASHLAMRACELTQYSKPVFLGTLAAAQAEAGDFQSAINSAEKAINLATTLELEATATKNKQLLELYRNSKPYRNK